MSCALLALCLLSGCAGFHDLRERDFQAFLRADADGSGKLDRQEAPRLLPSSARFEQYDVDGDGLIAWTEVQHVDSLAKGRYFAPEPR
jgi:hypothetical protein